MYKTSARTSFNVMKTYLADYMKKTCLLKNYDIHVDCKQFAPNDLKNI